jgi:Cu+-exporting ATPase
MGLEPPTRVTLDPVCGMEVDEQNPGATQEYEKKTYYFCSTECTDQFAKKPDVYTGF